MAFSSRNLRGDCKNHLAPKEPIMGVVFVFVLGERRKRLMLSGGGFGVLMLIRMSLGSVQRLDPSFSWGPAANKRPEPGRIGDPLGVYLVKGSFPRRTRALRLTVEMERTWILSLFIKLGANLIVQITFYPRILHRKENVPAFLFWLSRICVYILLSIKYFNHIVYLLLLKFT